MTDLRFFARNSAITRLKDAVPRSKRRLIFLLFLLFTLSSPLVAALLFSDDFSSEAQSNLNWIVVAENDPPLTFQQGYALLENSSSTYIAFVMHALGRKPSAVNFTGRILSDIPGAGLFYCTGKEGGFYLGYAVIVGDKELLLLEYGAQGEKTLLIRECSFVSSGNNTLSISGGDGQLRVFCNGYFQFSFPNSLGDAGDVAMVVPPSSAVAFDDVSVADTIADSVRFPPLRDSLKNQTLWGWSLSGSGNYASDTGGLHIRTATGQVAYAGIWVPLADFHMSVTLRHEGVKSGKPFGFVLFDRDGDKGDSVVPALRFGIIASGGVLIEKRTDAGWVELEDGVFSGSMSGERDSLTLSRRDSVCTFTVNTTDVASIGGVYTVAAGAGLFVAESLSVYFRDFSLFDQSEEPLMLERGKIVPRPYQARPADTGFDLMGRVVGSGSFEQYSHRRHSAPAVTILPSGRKCISGMGKK